MPFDPDKLSSYPEQPGVYIMKDRKNVVIYIGKAKVLRDRVKQYFVPGRDGRPQIPHLVARVENIETIVVSSEKEALLLENTLIKQHQPRYNVLLKDDKSYISLVITHKHKWPMIRLVRYKGKPRDDGMYFGPYTNVHAARQTLDLINKIFPMRQCSDRELERRERPCLLYHIHKCCAPCVNYCSKEEYDGYVNRSIQFLQGKNSEVLKGLHEELDEASEKLDFENAGRIHKIIQQVEKTIESQQVHRVETVDTDAFGIYRQGDEVSLAKMIFRGGKLVGATNHHFSKVVQEDASLMESFILQHYLDQVDTPREILLSPTLESTKVLADLLSEEGGRKIQIQSPQRGDKLKLLQMAEKNAEAVFHQEKDVSAIREKTLLQMKERFRLTNFPQRIECFDNSHISGSERVAAMVVFTDGEIDKARYRKYKIKGVEQGDDYAMMQEVLTRRYKRAKEEDSLPSLIIVDGGKGQLNIARKVLSELDIVAVDVIGLAKEEGRHDKGMTSEQVFLQNVKDPILLRKDSPILFLLQRIRDEAHRVAISFHRQRQRKKTLHSFLDDIPGIGPVKRKALLQHLGSVKKIKEATEKELQQVKGLSKANVRTILEFIAAEKSEG